MLKFPKEFLVRLQLQKRKQINQLQLLEFHFSFRDLEENPDFCLHCAMSDSSGSSGEFQTTGIAVRVQDKEIRDLAESISNFRPSVRSLLFELYVTDALSTAYRSGQPKRRRWQLYSAMVEGS